MEITKKIIFTLENPMPPQWMMYPHIELGSIGWRMGYGESYAEAHYIWYTKLAENEQQKYREMFPPPKLWRGYYDGFKDWEFAEGMEGVRFWNKDGMMAYSREKLIGEYNAGEQIEYLFFWKPNHGVIDKSCLGQWQPSTFHVGLSTYCCAEQYMMDDKAGLSGDNETRKLIMDATNPREIQQLGRQIKHFKQDLWDKVKYSTVLNANYYKFTQNDEMRNFLLSTGDKVLVEASPIDTVWGIGLSENDTQCHNPNTWKGQNLLGFALMEVRDDLRTAYQNYDMIDWMAVNDWHNW